VKNPKIVVEKGGEKKAGTTIRTGRVGNCTPTRKGEKRNILGAGLARGGAPPGESTDIGVRGKKRMA